MALDGVYQWTDENGHVYFGNVPPQPQEKYTLGDTIKPAQKEPESVVDKEAQASKSVVPVEKEMLVKQPAPIRKLHKNELKERISKLRQDAGEVAFPLNAQKASVQKQVKEQTEKNVEMPVSAEAASPAINQKIEVLVDETLDEAPLESQKDTDKCGFFKDYVEQYKLKKSEGCPGPHCDVYKRQLKKFSLKQKRYC